MTKTEMRILETLWKSETPLCAGDILEQNPDIKEITLRTALKNMLKKFDFRRRHDPTDKKITQELSEQM